MSVTTTVVASDSGMPCCCARYTRAKACQTLPGKYLPRFEVEYTRSAGRADTVEPNARAITHQARAPQTVATIIALSDAPTAHGSSCHWYSRSFSQPPSSATTSPPNSSSTTSARVSVVMDHPEPLEGSPPRDGSAGGTTRWLVVTGSVRSNLAKCAAFYQEGRTACALGTACRARTEPVCIPRSAPPARRPAGLSGERASHTR